MRQVRKAEQRRSRISRRHGWAWPLCIAVLSASLLLSVMGCGGKDSTAQNSQGGNSSNTTNASGGPAPAGEPVVIGAIVSATGPNSALGAQERNVLEMMEAKINQEGGVLGRPLDVIVEDDKTDAKEAVTAANRLLDQKKAVAIIAATGSASTLAVKPITAERKVPQIAMAAANDITDAPPTEWIWRTPHKDAMAVARALTYISKSLGAKKIAVLHDENAFGSSGAKEIERTAGNYGLEIVAVEPYKTDDTDLTSQLTKIRAAGPEVIVVWGTNPGPALAAKNMKQLGMKIPYVGSHGIANRTFIELGGDAVEGVVFPAGRLLVPDSITNPEQKKVTQEFIDLYKATYNEMPNTFAGYAFEAITLLVAAIEKAKSTEATAIQAALNSTKGFVGPDGIYNYSETDHDGLTADQMIIVKIENGKWVLVE